MFVNVNGRTRNEPTIVSLVSQRALPSHRIQQGSTAQQACGDNSAAQGASEKKFGPIFSPIFGPFFQSLLTEIPPSIKVLTYGCSKWIFSPFFGPLFSIAKKLLNHDSRGFATDNDIFRQSEVNLGFTFVRKCTSTFGEQINSVRGGFNVFARRQRVRNDHSTECLSRAWYLAIS